MVGVYKDVKSPLRQFPIRNQIVSCRHTHQDRPMAQVVAQSGIGLGESEYFVGLGLL